MRLQRFLWWIYKINGRGALPDHLCIGNFIPVVKRVRPEVLISSIFQKNWLEIEGSLTLRIRIFTVKGPQMSIHCSSLRRLYFPLVLESVLIVVISVLRPKGGFIPVQECVWFIEVCNQNVRGTHPIRTFQ